MAGANTISSSLRQKGQILALSKPRYRTFTSTTLRSRGGSALAGQFHNALATQMSKQKSLATRQSSMRRDQVPDDVGLLTETLIKPARKNLPALLSKQWRRRIQIERLAIMQKLRDFISLYYLSRWDVARDPITNKRIKQSLLLSERHLMARTLHRQLYQSIASSDLSTIEKIACTGLKRQLQLKVSQKKAIQAPDETWTVNYKGLMGSLPDRLPWFLQILIPAQLKATQIIADRCANFPYNETSRIRQLVVKIRSSQAIDRHNGKGPVKSSKDEYIVLQRILIDGEDDGWKIWGTTKPSSKEAIDELIAAPAQTGRQTLMERFKGLFMSASDKGLKMG